MGKTETPAISPGREDPEEGDAHEFLSRLAVALDKLESKKQVKVTDASTPPLV